MISDKERYEAFEFWYVHYFGVSVTKNHRGNYDTCFDCIDVDDVFFAGFKACQELMQKRIEELEKDSRVLALALADCKKYNGDTTKIESIIREALKQIEEE
jgi:hypothetical protein